MDVLKELMPEAYQVLINQNTIVMKDSALSTKTKELMAVALSIAVRCEPCLKVHLRRAKESGATAEEIAESLAVATLMCGGPAYVWSKKIVDEETSKTEKNQEDKMDELTKELVGIASSIAGHCRPCFLYHLKEAKKL